MVEVDVDVDVDVKGMARVRWSPIPNIARLQSGCSTRCAKLKKLRVVMGGKV